MWLTSGVEDWVPREERCGGLGVAIRRREDCLTSGAPCVAVEWCGGKVAAVCVGLARSGACCTWRCVEVGGWRVGCGLCTS